MLINVSAPDKLSLINLLTSETVKLSIILLISSKEYISSPIKLLYDNVFIQYLFSLTAEL